jgi:hypothetical protein
VQDLKFRIQVETVSGVRANGLAAVKGSSHDEVEEMKNVFEERMDEDFYVVSNGDVSMLSTSENLDQGSYYVAFNGYLEDRSGVPEEKIAEVYEKHGSDFLQNLNGSFRLVLYDREKETLFASSDKIGRKVIYYTEDTGDFICCSHMAPLLSHGQVDREIDEQAVYNFLQSWSVSFAGGRRLIKGVSRLWPSHVLIYSDNEMEARKFWEVYSQWRDVSDQTAVNAMDGLLTEAAESLVQRVEGPVNIFLSGGFDSVFLTKLISEVSDRRIDTYTWGWKDEHFRDAERMSDRLGTNQHSMKFDYGLPGQEEIGFYEEPHNAFVRYPFRELYQEHGLKNFWTGLNSQATFPVCLKNVRKMDRVRPVSPVLRRLNTQQLEHFIGENIDYKLSKALAILSSNRHSAGIVNDWGLRKSHAEEIISDRLSNANRSVDDILDQRWRLERLNYQDNYSYMQLRARDTARYAYYSQYLEHIDVFGYTPLVEYSYSLPMSQKKNRRLLQKIAKGRVPDRIITKGASGWDFVSKQFRRMIEEDRELYERKIQRFMERGYLALEAEEFLLQQPLEGLGRGRINQMIAVYLLEQWMEAFIDN